MSLSPLDLFTVECRAVASGAKPKISNARHMARTTGPTLEHMRLAAEAYDLEEIEEGDELAFVRASYLPPL